MRQIGTFRPGKALLPELRNRIASKNADMTTDDSAPTTPQHVADLATETARLPALALLGVFGSVTTRSALLRQPDGTTLRVSTGDQVASKTVMAIAEDHVILERGNQTRVLTLPGT